MCCYNDKNGWKMEGKWIFFWVLVDLVIRRNVLFLNLNMFLKLIEIYVLCKVKFGCFDNLSYEYMILVIFVEDIGI